MKKVINRAPWHFDRVPLCMEKLKKGGHPNYVHYYCINV